MTTTLKQLATRLNLSITTVSRALDGYDDVARSTRSRVEAMARELNYEPNPAARSLRHKRAVAVVLPAERSQVKLVGGQVRHGMAGIQRCCIACQGSRAIKLPPTLAGILSSKCLGEFFMGLRRFVFCGAMIVCGNSVAVAQPVLPALQVDCGGVYDLCGYRDRQTKALVIPQKFERAFLFSDGLAAVRIKGRYGYIDVRGEMVIPARFNLAGPFNQGAC